MKTKLEVARFTHRFGRTHTIAALLATDPKHQNGAQKQVENLAYASRLFADEDLSKDLQTYCDYLDKCDGQSCAVCRLWGHIKGCPIRK